MLLMLLDLLIPTANAAAIGTDVGTYFADAVGVPAWEFAVFFAGAVLVIAILWAAWVARAQFVNFAESRIRAGTFLWSLAFTLAIVLFIWVYAAA